METAEQKRRKRLIWAVIIVVLLLCYPAYHYTVEWRGEGLAKEAADLLKQGQSQTALSKAQSALGLRPRSMRALRVAATVLSEEHRPEALGYWRAIVGRPDSVLSDYEGAIDTAASVQAFVVGEQLLDEASRRFGPAPTLVRRGASLFEKSGDPARSVQYAQRALKAHPGDDAVNLILQRQMLSLGTPAERAGAKDQILEIAARNPELRLEALKWIARLDGLKPSDLQKSGQLLNQVGGANMDRLLVGANLALKQDPKKLPEIARQVFVQGQAMSPETTELQDLARWMNLHGQYDKTLALVSAQRAMGNRELFLLRMDALAAQSQWAEVDRTLTEDNLPIEPVLTSLFKIRARRQAGVKTPMDDLWKDLERNLLQQPGACAYVGQYLETMGEQTRLEALYRAVIRVAPKTVAAYAGLIRLAESRGNLEELLAILKDARERDPDNILYKNDYSYLTLLLGQNTEAASTTAEALNKEHPENIGFRVTCALAKLVRGDTNGAYAVLNTQPVDWARLTPGQQAVVASVEAGKGDTAQARELAKSIATQRLKKPELELLNGWLKH